MACGHLARVARVLRAIDQVQKERNMRARMIIGVAAVVAGLWDARGACGQTSGAAHGAGAKETIISTSGTARVERSPDYVDVLVGVVTEETTAAASQMEASKVMEATLGAVKGLKLEGMQPQTGSVELTPKYPQNYYSNSSAKIIGYTAKIMLRVRTTEIGSVARIVDAALGAGCNRVDQVEFGIKEALAAREEAITLATKAAKRKAEVMAAALDLHLARVVEATTSSRQMGGWYGNRMSTSNVAQLANESAGGGEGTEGSAVVPGKVEVWVDVNLTFTAAGEK